jgi:hypothetical protein
MFKITQKALKKILTILKPGTNKAISVQAGCVNFRKDTITTESPFFSVSCPLKSGIEGSYQLTDFLKIVGQIKASSEVHLKKTPKTLQISVAEGKKKLQFALKNQWETPSSTLPAPDDKGWKDIPNGFNDGLANTFPIARKSASPSNHLHCVHITPKYFAATDGSRVVMRAVKNHLSKPVILPAASIKELLKIDPTSYAQKGPHLFFRNDDGVIYCLSEFLDEFPEIAHLFKIKLGPSIETDEAFKEIVQTANAMDAQRIELNFTGSGTVTLLAMTQSGPFKGTAPAEYKGPDFKIKMRPEFLLDGLQYSNTFAFSEDKQYLAVFTVNTRYVAGALLE